MKMARVLPTEADLIRYDFAVAGHDGTLTVADGVFFIKPCTLAELQFYEDSRLRPEFAEIMPTYFGTLDLNQQTSDTTLEEQGAMLVTQLSIPENGYPPLPRIKKIITNKSVCLENAAYGFKKPNILDVKLGVRLWADDAPQEKKTRFDKVTAETTHKDLGFRIAGMRVWQGHNAPQGIDVDELGYKIYDKHYGRYLVNKDNVADAFRNFIFTESAGVDEELGKLVTQLFLSDLALIQETLESHETRMYSASLLFVFEGDGEALRIAMEEASKPLSNGNESEAADEEEEDESMDEEEASPKIYSLKVIDFAHAQWVPGMGPDENSLLGVRSVTKILNDLAA